MQDIRYRQLCIMATITEIEQTHDIIITRKGNQINIFYFHGNAKREKEGGHTERIWEKGLSIDKTKN